MIEFDPRKDAVNRAKHGLSLADFERFDDIPAVAIDDRFDYGEQRLQARGRIAGQGYCIVYVATDVGIRLISSRRAHERRCVVMTDQLPPDFDENSGWTEEITQRSKLADRVHHPHVVAALTRSARAWEEVTLELDRDVVEKFRATGRGWQNRINDVLRAAEIELDYPKTNAA